jgi:hypothetical protein
MIFEYSYKQRKYLVLKANALLDDKPDSTKKREILALQIVQER